MYQLMNVDDVVERLESTHTEFVEDILKQNEMYRLPINESPTLDKLHKPNGAPETPVARITGFLKTLSDEIQEGQDILCYLRSIEEATGDTHLTATASTTVNVAVMEKCHALYEVASTDAEEAKKQVLVDLADWLADMVLYIRSEAMKFGIPLEAVQQAVMASNFLKLPSDGIPVHDENGKFLKDMTNYVPPENMIYTLMFDPDFRDLEAEDESDLEDDDGDSESFDDE